jgi:hypothetical protein
MPSIERNDFSKLKTSYVSSAREDLIYFASHEYLLQLTLLFLQ